MRRVGDLCVAHPLSSVPCCLVIIVVFGGSWMHPRSACTCLLCVDRGSLQSAAFVCVLCSPCAFFSPGFIAGWPLPSPRPGSRPSMLSGLASLLASSVDGVADLHLGCPEVTAIPLFSAILPGSELRCGDFRRAVPHHAFPSRLRLIRCIRMPPSFSSMFGSRL